MRTLFAGVVLGCLLLAGCASVPVYRPASTPNDYGYRDSALTDARYQVSFAGDYGVARETVRKLALLRAAQVTLAHGAERFRIVSRKTDNVTSHFGPSATIGYGYPFWMANVGLTRGFERTRYETIIEIQIGPQIPESGPDVYDATKVSQHLSAAAEQD